MVPLYGDQEGYDKITGCPSYSFMVIGVSLLGHYTFDIFETFLFPLQYYVYLGGQPYVDLGLGTHRVKCRVHEKFK